MAYAIYFAIAGEEKNNPIKNLHGGTQSVGERCNKLCADAHAVQHQSKYGDVKFPGKIHTQERLILECISIL